MRGGRHVRPQRRAAVAGRGRRARLPAERDGARPRAAPHAARRRDGVRPAQSLLRGRGRPESRTRRRAPATRCSLNTGNRDPPQEDDAIETLLQLRVDGLILAAAPAREPRSSRRQPRGAGGAGRARGAGGVGGQRDQRRLGGRRRGGEALRLARPPAHRAHRRRPGRGRRDRRRGYEDGHEAPAASRKFVRVVAGRLHRRGRAHGRACCCSTSGRGPPPSSPPTTSPPSAPSTRSRRAGCKRARRRLAGRLRQHLAGRAAPHLADHRPPAAAGDGADRGSSTLLERSTTSASSRGGWCSPRAWSCAHPPRRRRRERGRES